MTSPGWCKVCANLLLVREINRRLKLGATLRSTAEWCAAHDFQVTRQKLADHKRHITESKRTHVEHARRNPVIRQPANDRHVTSCCCERLRQELLRVLVQ